MKYYGDIELIGGSFKGKVEGLFTAPTFDAEDVGRLFFDLTTSTLMVNNGTTYVSASLPSDFSNLISSLGGNWLTSSFGFNPAPFNGLNILTGLTANDSLFTVIEQLSEAISSSNNKLESLSDVTVDATIKAGDICYFNGVSYSFSDPTSLISTYGNLELSGLSDVDFSGVANGQSLCYNGNTHKIVPANIVTQIEDFTSSTSHTITHSLGVQYCGITIINRSNDTLINDATVVFSDINQIDITLTTAAPILVFLIAQPSFGN